MILVDRNRNDTLPSDDAGKKYNNLSKTCCIIIKGEGGGKYIKLYNL